MKIVVTIVLGIMFLCFVNGFVWAQNSLPHAENFDYPSGALDGNGRWENHSGTLNEIQVVDGNLSYSGYMSPLGRSVALSSTFSEDSNTDFTAQTGTDGSTIYASFLLNVTNQTGLGTGAYIFHFMRRGTTTFNSRIWIRSAGSGFNLGISKTSNSANVVWDGTELSLSTTYLIVHNYEWINGTDNDEVNLWINPSLSGPEPAANVTQTSSTDFNGNLDAWAIRHTSGSPNAIIDGLRIGNLWVDAPLPVTLASFTASAGNQRVTLRWSTASEQENVGFNILRSNEKKGTYTQISTYENNPDLQGQFNSATQTNYRFIDQTVVNGVTYWYKLVDVDVNGVPTEHGPMSATPHAVGNDVTTISAIPAGSFELHPNFPNPFNPSTTLRFDIPALSRQNQTVEVAIFNAQGQRVKTLFKGILAPGTHELSWNGESDNGTRVSSGMYYAKLRMDNLVRTSKMLLLK